MPVVTLELPQALLDRLQQIAAERSVPLEAVACQILALYVELPDSPPLPHPDSFRLPQRPAQFDPAKVKALLADLEGVKQFLAGRTQRMEKSPDELAAAVRMCLAELHQVKLEALMALYERADHSEEEEAKIQTLIEELKLLDALRDVRVVGVVEG